MKAPIIGTAVSLGKNVVRRITPGSARVLPLDVRRRPDAPPMAVRSDPPKPTLPGGASVRVCDKESA